MFYRRVYYDRDEACADCFGWLMALLVVVAIIVVAILYIGAYILLAFVIVGAIFGVVVSVFALFKSLPDAINDTRYMYTSGNMFLSIIAHAWCFIKSLVVNTVKNEIGFASLAFSKSQGFKLLAFRKWLYIAMGVAVMVCGLLVVVAILMFFVTLVLGIVAAILSLAVALIALTAGVSIIVDIAVSGKNFVVSFIDDTVFGCFKFNGWAELSDIGAIPVDWVSNMWSMIRDAWEKSLEFGSDIKDNFSYHPWYSPMKYISLAFWLMMPVACALITAIASVLLFIVSIPVYIANILFILVKSLVGLIKR